MFVAEVGRRKLHSNGLRPCVGRKFVVEQSPIEASNRGLEKTVPSKLRPSSRMALGSYGIPYNREGEMA